MCSGLLTPTCTKHATTKPVRAYLSYQKSCTVAAASQRHEAISRRAVLSAPLLVVIPGRENDAGFGIISEAVDAAQDRAVVRIEAGIYRERIVLGRSLTLEAWPEGAEVTVVWETSKPYEAVLESSAPSAAVRGLRLRHSSPSVANNYAVFMQGGSLRLENCDISSATGSGVGSEGGSLSLLDCSIHGCKRHGAAVFGGLDGSEGAAVVEDCRIAGNVQNGILVMDSASAVVRRSAITSNGAYGICVRDGACQQEGSVLDNNRMGASFPA